MMNPGLKGPKGDKGDPGEGMTRGARHAVIFLFCLSLLLSGANLLWTQRQVSQIRRVTATVASQHRVQVYACQLGNDTRAQELRLWEHIIAIAAVPPHETAAQRRARQARLTGFLAYVRRIFAPRDCAAIYRLKR